MPQHLLIDGYNLIHKVPFLRDKLNVLEQARNRLVAWVQDYQPQGRTPNDVTIIFDGSDEVFHSPDLSGIKVRFSRGEKADDLIKNIIRDALKPADMVLVSDDRQLCLDVKALGASYWSVDFFIQKMHQKQRKRITPMQTQDDKQISSFKQQQINEELKQKWLK